MIVQKKKKLQEKGKKELSLKADAHKTKKIAVLMRLNADKY